MTPPDGTVFCPYREKDWTDEEYAEVRGRYEAKRQCMLRNGVRILRRADMLEIIRAVNEARGEGRLEEHRTGQAV